MKKVYLSLFMPSLLIMTILSSCSQSERNEASGRPPDIPQPEKRDPVTIKVMFHKSLSDVFKMYVDPALKEKLPHITLEYVESTTKLEELITAGNVPDVIMPNGDLFPYLDLGLPIDLTDLIKKHNFNLNKIEPSLIDSIKSFGAKGELYALPSDRGAPILVYNKDIFDKFAVPYPKEGITWEETIELAKKLTREVDGTFYRGLSVGFGTFTSQLELPAFDAIGKAALFTPGWRQAAALWKQYNEIPNISKSRGGRDGFIKDQTLAMNIDHPSLLIREPVDGLRWDMVGSPTFSNGLTSAGLGSMFSITSTSQHKDDAFRVIDLWFSDKIQSAISRDASLIPSVITPEVLKVYGTAKISSKGLNLQTNFPKKQAVKVAQRNGEIANPIINKAFTEIAAGQRDINTILREAEELINKGVADKTKR